MKQIWFFGRTDGLSAGETERQRYRDIHLNLWVLYSRISNGVVPLISRLYSFDICCCDCIFKFLMYIYYFTVEDVCVFGCHKLESNIVSQFRFFC